MTGVADELLAESAPLYTSVVPAQLQRILDDAPGLPQLDELMRRFSAILVGGQSIPETLVKRAADAGYRLIRTYGSSETAGGCVWDQRPIGDTRVRDIDGRLAIAGSVLAAGYVGDPERTARSFVMEGDERWYLTDDAGHVTDDGLVVVDGRLDDVIVSGGVDDYVSDPGVDLEVFDWDNYHAADEVDQAQMGLPAHFADLAGDCPIEGEDK
jgi:O-succinylbenzoic acid--CoA ligase